MKTKIVLRNLLTVLKRFRMASLLNILGLSVAFAAFIVIVAQVRYDNGFNKFHSKSERIFRVDRSQDKGASYLPILSQPLIDKLLESAPQIESGAMVDLFTSIANPYLRVEKNGQFEGYETEMTTVYPDFLPLFDFDMVEGSYEIFRQPGQVVLPLSTARKMFGDEPATGRPITVVGQGDSVMTVAGVYRDFPANTLVSNVAYLSAMPRVYDAQSAEWSNSSYYLYISLYNAESRAETEVLLTQAVREVWPEDEDMIRLMPLEDIYFDQATEFDFTPKGNRGAAWMLSAIAVLILLIAGINFVNFSSSLAPLRMKSINTQKVLGASQGLLRGSLVAEAVGISLIAFVLSLVWVWIISRTGLTAFFNADIALSANLPIVWTTLGVAVVVGLGAGIYPAFYMTSFPAALVLKGSFGLSANGRKLRTALVGFQYVVSTGLIIAAIFMQLQNSFMRQSGVGFDTGHLAEVKLNTQLVTGKRDALVARLKENASVEDVGFAMFSIGGDDMISSWGRQDNEGEYFEFYVMPVSWNLPRMLGLEITDGRGFQEGDEQKTTETALFNESAYRRMPAADPESGRSFWNMEMVGVVRDFNYRTLRSSVEPMAMVMGTAWAEPLMTTMYVKTAGDPCAAIKDIRRSIAAVDPTYPADVRFFDEIFERAYRKERETTGLITLFSLLAIVISLVGVFGLVMFETQYRRKEVGVRKVFGSTIGQILSMFNRSFMRIVAVCFVLAAPLAWYGVRGWLTGFAYRTPLHWWVFALSLLIVLLITLTTVTIQSWRVASANPVNALKTE